MCIRRFRQVGSDDTNYNHTISGFKTSFHAGLGDIYWAEYSRFDHHKCEGYQVGCSAYI